MSSTVIIILSVAGGALLIFLVGYSIMERRRIRETGIAVEGLVVDVEREYNGNTSTATHILHIEYTSAKGELIRGTYRDVFYPSSYEAGDRLPIIYDAENARKFILAEMRKK